MSRDARGGNIEEYERFSILMSRLAALQGVSVPARRFNYVLSRMVESGLSLDERLKKCWLVVFEKGSFQVIDGVPERKDLPALWVGANGQVSMVTSLSSDGGLVFEQENKTNTTDKKNGSTAGVVLKLLTVDDNNSASTKISSAKELFLKSLSRQKVALAEGVFSSFIVTVLALSASLYTMQVYDRVIPNQGYSTLWVLTFGVCVSILFETMIKIARSNLIERACKKIDMDVSAEFFRFAIGIRLDSRPQTVGTFASQIRQYESVRQFMTSATLFMFADAPFALLLLLVIAYICLPVAIVPSLFLPIVLLTSVIFWPILNRLTVKQVTDSNRKSGILVDAFEGIETIKACQAEWRFTDAWRELIKKLADREMKIRNITMISVTLGQAIQQMCYVSMVVVGVISIATGKLTQGGLIACTILGGRVLGTLSSVPSIVLQWQQTRAALMGLDSVIGLPSDIKQDARQVVPENSQADLRLQAVEFRYNNDSPLISIKALKITPGSRIAIVGPVGAGKSTMLKLIAGLYKPHHGRVLFDGIDMASLSSNYIRENVAYLPQDSRLFAGTLRDNLTLGLSVKSDEELLGVCRKTGLDRFISEHPLGLSLPISEGGRGLSGGQRQLVALTRILLGNAKIYLLDEPTASLDGDFEMSAMEALSTHMRPTDVLVVVTHKTSIFQYIDRLMVADKGTILIDGQKEGVLEKLRAKQEPRVNLRRGNE